MIIYKCIICGDEMFSDIYKILDTGIFYEVEGKMISRTEDIDDSLIGGNASAEEACDGNLSSTVSGIDIVLNHKLQEVPSLDKKAFLAYAKEYLKTVKAKLEESKPDRVDSFMKEAQVAVKELLPKLKDYQFFIGESLNGDGAMGMLNFREDGVTPYMLFFKDGLEEEKC
ncbi:translationally-controlled tumor protein homolog [Menidia menidia]